jgi:hypothetical protein
VKPQAGQRRRLTSPLSSAWVIHSSGVAQFEQKRVSNAMEVPVRV